MIYSNDKQQTQDIKKFLRPNPQMKGFGIKDAPKERKGTAGSPANRNLALRGQK